MPFDSRDSETPLEYLDRYYALVMDYVPQDRPASPLELMVYIRSTLQVCRPERGAGGRRYGIVGARERRGRIMRD